MKRSVRVFTVDEMSAGSNALSCLIDEARTTRDRSLIRRIRRYWQFDCFGRGSRRGERWSSILRKIDTEGSTWIVWWYDGVARFLLQQEKS
jgi:hypothetical protein